MLSVTATNLPRLMACNGSRLMEGHVSSINEPNVVQDEGNAAHWLIEQVYKGLFETDVLIDRKAPNGTYITVEIAEHAEGFLERIGKGGFIEYETSFRGENWQVLSRVDHWKFENTILFIDDFKYGWGIVEVIKNWTLIAHAIGICLKHQIAPSRIVFTIHQPRPYHPQGRIRYWEISYNELLELYAEINRVLSNPSDVLNTGPHCYKCSAIATCPAARLAELNGIDASELAFNESIDNDHLSFQMDHLKRAAAILKLRIDAYEELAIHRIKKGEIVKNYFADKEMSNTVWYDNITPEYMKILTGLDLKQDKLITPNQAKKKGVLESIIAVTTTRHEKGTKLVRMDANKKAEKLFKKE